MYLDKSSETDLNISKEIVLLETNNLVDITNCKINNNCPAIFLNGDLQMTEMVLVGNVALKII